MLISDTLVKYTITKEDGEQVVTYFTEISENNIIELAKLEVDSSILANPDKKLLLLQLLMTPHVHISLLDAIIPFVEQITPQLEGNLKDSLQNWLTQANSLLTPPK